MLQKGTARLRRFALSGDRSYGFLDSYNMWLIKVKESQQFQFFASYAIDIHANEFQPTSKAAFICTTR